MLREAVLPGSVPRPVAEGDDDADMVHVVAASAAASFMEEDSGDLVVSRPGANPDGKASRPSPTPRVMSPVPRDRRAPNTGEARPSDAEEPTNPGIREVPRSTLPDTPVSSSSHAHASRPERDFVALFAEGESLEAGERIRLCLAIGRLLVRKRILGLDELREELLRQR